MDRPPVGLIWTAGRLLPRRMGLVRPQALTCPHGHAITDRRHVLVGALRCIRCSGTFSPSATRELVYVLSMHDEADRWIFAADTNEAETRLWSDRGFTADDVLEWLGAVLPVRVGPAVEAVCR